MEKRMDVFISGVGMTKFGRSKDLLEKMMADAARLALKDAQLERREEGLSGNEGRALCLRKTYPLETLETLDERVIQLK
jgi:acetyl-CoA acetyltransferase